MSFFSELKRRNVHRALAAYIAGAWLLTEITGMLTEVYGAPDWVMKVVLALMLAGIIPAAIISWHYELTSSGLQKDADVSDEARPRSRRGFNLAIVAMLAAAVAIVFLFREEITGEPEARAPSSGPPMVAVLPFTSTSLDGDGAFFATGIHDDLLTQLAQLKSLRVISRTSVMEYQDTQRNIREIGRQLGADSILEGSVQSAGDRIRINAQLIDARTDEHLWAETYDRELTVESIFDVQSEISRAIAAAMHTSLSDTETDSLSQLPTDNMAAYRAFHEAMELRDEFRHGSDEYREGLLRAVELDPEFTRALTELVGEYTLNYFHEPDPEDLRKAEQALEQIRDVSPGSVEFLKAQAYYTYYVLRDYATALDLVQQAQVLRPSDVRLLELTEWIQRRMLLWDERIETLRQARALDPALPRWALRLTSALLDSHRYDEAREVAESYMAQRTPAQQLSLADAYLEWLYQLLLFAEHREANRLVTAVFEMVEERPEHVSPEFVPGVLVFNRQFDAAREWLDRFPEDLRVAPSPHRLSIYAENALLTAWLLGDQEWLDRLLAEAREQLVPLELNEAEFTQYHAFLNQALVSALEKQPEATVQAVDDWRKLAALDAPIRLLNLGRSCLYLGIAGLDTEATACLRQALSEPSGAYAFFDAWLPMYDPVRDQPEFSRLLSELEARFGPVITSH